MYKNILVPIDGSPLSRSAAKEAVAFALLAYLHVNGEAGNVPRATGANGPRILGKLTPK